MFLKQLALRYLPKSLQKLVRSRHYTNQLRHYPLDAEPDLAGCQALLKPGDVFIDVGANIGVYTKFCSGLVGPSGEVHSLEPVPDTFGYLSHNVQALSLRNVRLYNLAASDQDQDHAAMSMPDYASGGANIYEARLSAEGNIPVKTARLDSLFPKLQPKLIKCDVEGHEVACIEGARELIARARPGWVIEVSHPQTFALLQSLGYGVWVWDDARFRPSTPEDKRPNYFFFHHENRPAAVTA